jgi:hypothetical protein
MRSGVSATRRADHATGRYEVLTADSADELRYKTRKHYPGLIDGPVATSQQ